MEADKVKENVDAPITPEEDMEPRMETLSLNDDRSDEDMQKDQQDGMGKKKKEDASAENILTRRMGKMKTTDLRDVEASVTGIAEISMKGMAMCPSLKRIIKKKTTMKLNIPIKTAGREGVR